jgi:hypothetical protein
VLLALVAAAARAHHTPGGHAGIHQPPRGVGNYLFSIGAVLAVAMALFMVYLWFSERDLLAEAHRKRQKRGMRRSLIFILVVALLVSVAGRLHLWHGRPLRHQAEKVNTGAHSNQKNRKLDQPAKVRPPDFKLLPVLIATAGGLVLLGFIGLRTMRRERLGLLEPHQLELELESLLDDTLADLRAMKDPREAIIAAYGRMERLFAASGLPREPSEAPMEYLERALKEVRASGSALRRLTALFEWAKFSDHPVDASMRDDAILALTQVRDELRANRTEREIAEAQRAEFERERADAGDDGDRTYGEDPFSTLGEKVKGDIYTQR